MQGQEPHGAAVDFGLDGVDRLVTGDHAFGAFGIAGGQGLDGGGELGLGQAAHGRQPVGERGKVGRDGAATVDLFRRPRESKGIGKCHASPHGRTRLWQGPAPRPGRFRRAWSSRACGEREITGTEHCKYDVTIRIQYRRRPYLL